MISATRSLEWLTEGGATTYTARYQEKKASIAGTLTRLRTRRQRLRAQRERTQERQNIQWLRDHGWVVRTEAGLSLVRPAIVE